VKPMRKTKTNRILANVESETLRIPCPYYLVEPEPPVKPVDPSDEQRRQKAIDDAIARLRSRERQNCRVAARELPPTGLLRTQARQGF
jgi:hypothetical protein